VITFEQYAKFLRGSVRRIEPEKVRALARLGDHAQQLAVHYIGHEMPEFAPLSEATMEGFVHPYGFRIPGKRELGYVGHESTTDPLLRTGALRDSIRAESDDHRMVVGSNSQIAVYQELGTHNPLTGDIPPRPFLALALRNSTDYAEEVFYEAAVALLVPPGAKP
jgi:phage gpG-like protein